MVSQYITFQASRVSYCCWGRGPRLLLCFHGYGEAADSFSFLEEFLGEACTILAIDLPYHGQTDWKEGILAPPTLLSLIDQLLPSLPSAQKQGWWLMGYSMGGRIALSLLENAPDRIDRLILLAPDGLVVNPWYWLATQTTAGRQLFKYTVNNPGWFFFLLRAGNKLGLVNPSVYKFVSAYVSNNDVRKSLYTRWTGLRRFKPPLRVIKDIIRRRQLPVQLLYGRFDRIILAKRGERFRKGIEPWCELTVIPSGHQLLKKDHIQALFSAYIYR